MASYLVSALCRATLRSDGEVAVGFILEYIDRNRLEHPVHLPRPAGSGGARCVDPSGGLGVAACAPGGRALSFVTRFRAVQGAAYATAVCVLWIVTFLFGAWISTPNAMPDIRGTIERDGLLENAGLFSS